MDVFCRLFGSDVGFLYLCSFNVKHRFNGTIQKNSYWYTGCDVWSCGEIDSKPYPQIPWFLGNLATFTNLALSKN